MTRAKAERRLADWEQFATSLFDGYEFGLDDYRNDLDGRRLLDDAALDDAQRRRLDAADAVVRAATDAAAVCVWGSQVAASERFEPGRHWFYFRVPKQPGDELAADLRRLR